MGIITAIIFFCTLIYYLVRYTRKGIRYLMRGAGDQEDNTSEEEVELDIPDEIMEVVFPGGEEEIKREVNKLVSLLPTEHPKDLIQFVLIAGSVYFGRSEDKSEGKLIAYIQEISQSRLTAAEGKIIHDFIYGRALRVQFFGEVEEADFNAFMNDIQELTGCDADEIPGATGDFGTKLSNPIPVKGIASIDYYLNRIRTKAGARITWERLGSKMPQGSSLPIDIYQIWDLEEKEIAQFYISPYHKRVSNKAPVGFKLLSKADLDTPTTKTPASHSPEPTATYSKERELVPASLIVTNTDEDCNEEIEVHDLRLLAASTAVLAAYASIASQDLEQAAENWQQAVSDLDDFPGPDDTKTIHLLRSVSQLSQHLNHPDTAERFLERALRAQLKIKRLTRNFCLIRSTT